MKFRPHTIPGNCHPLVRELFVQMNAQKITLRELAWRTGMTEDAFKYWRKKGSPTVVSLAAALNAIGFELTTKRMETRVDR